MDLFLIAGLGNPGREYELTRHNIGWMLVDALAGGVGVAWKKEGRSDALVAKARIGRSDCILVKPQTFMNESGQSVGGIMRYFGIAPEKILVAHDEFQIPVGEMKISIGGGDGGHNGVASVMAHAGNKFVRYRLGIGGTRPLDNGLRGFVLDRFEAPEIELIRSKMAEFVSGVRLVVDSGPTIAMNHLNKRIKTNDRHATA
ncbi:MAG TPA: aminoacyl-tRNA hydrolase [Opitutales bacterium]|nr:aminoacyl-tRNA hydrolase [Opitutales bacterium]